MSESRTTNRNFKQIVNTFYNEEINQIDQEESSNQKKEGNIKIEPKILYDKFLGNMKVEFKIGNEKMYKIKNLSEFYTRMLEKQYYRYGEKLQFIHTKENFEKQSWGMLDFILQYAEMIKYANSNANSNYRYYGKTLSETSILLGNTGIDELFNLLEGKKVAFQRNEKIGEIELTKQQPKIEFNLKKIKDEEYVITPNIEIFKIMIIKGKNHQYILDQEKLYRCTKEFEEANLKLLEIFRKNYMTEVHLGKEDLTQMFSIVIPKVKNAIHIENMTQEEIENYQPKNLRVKVYLDFDENNFLIANIKFIYGQKEELNPLEQNIKVNFPRNIIQETRALNLFRKTGFMFDHQKERLVLPKEEKIYQFLTQDINLYMQKFEILATDKFQSNQVKQPKIGSIGIKVENDLLTIDLKDLDINPEELEEMISKYKQKKKYHRLKDGTFINLEENEPIDFLDKLVSGTNITYQQIHQGEIKLPINRSLYLNQLLKNLKETQISKDKEYKEIINKLGTKQLDETIKIPKNLEDILRYYQKTGFQWLKILDHYQFGGILADDMGLRKNHSNVSRYHRRCPKRKTNF